MRNRGGDMMEGGLKFMDFARNTVKGCCVEKVVCSKEDSTVK